MTDAHEPPPNIPLAETRQHATHPDSHEPTIDHRRSGHLDDDIAPGRTHEDHDFLPYAPFGLDDVPHAFGDESLPTAMGLDADPSSTHDAGDAAISHHNHQHHQRHQPNHHHEQHLSPHTSTADAADSAILPHRFDHADPAVSRHAAHSPGSQTPVLFSPSSLQDLTASASRLPAIPGGASLTSYESVANQPSANAVEVVQSRQSIHSHAKKSSQSQEQPPPQPRALGQSQLSQQHPISLLLDTIETSVGKFTVAHGIPKDMAQVLQHKHDPKTPVFANQEDFVTAYVQHCQAGPLALQQTDGNGSGAAQEESTSALHVPSDRPNSSSGAPLVSLLDTPVSSSPAVAALHAGHSEQGQSSVLDSATSLTVATAESDNADVRVGDGTGQTQPQSSQQLSRQDREDLELEARKLWRLSADRVRKRRTRAARSQQQAEEERRRERERKRRARQALTPDEVLQIRLSEKARMRAARDSLDENDREMQRQAQREKARAKREQQTEEEREAARQRHRDFMRAHRNTLDPAQREARRRAERERSRRRRAAMTEEQKRREHQRRAERKRLARQRQRELAHGEPQAQVQLERDLASSSASSLAGAAAGLDSDSSATATSEAAVLPTTVLFPQPLSCMAACVTTSGPTAFRVLPSVPLASMSYTVAQPFSSSSSTNISTTSPYFSAVTTHALVLTPSVAASSSGLPATMSSIVPSAALSPAAVGTGPTQQHNSSLGRTLGSAGPVLSHHSQQPHVVISQGGTIDPELNHTQLIESQSPSSAVSRDPAAGSDGMPFSVQEVQAPLPPTPIEYDAISTTPTADRRLMSRRANRSHLHAAAEPGQLLPGVRRDDELDISSQSREQVEVEIGRPSQSQNDGPPSFVALPAFDSVNTRDSPT